MDIAAFDLGGACGWATQIGSELSHGWWKLTTASKKDTPGTRFSRFRHNITDMLERFTDITNTLFVYENVCGHRGVKAAHAYGGYRAILLDVLEERGVCGNCYPVNVGEIKRYATSNWKESKEGMIGALETLNIHVKSDDEADAIWLLLYARDNLSGIEL